MAWCCSAVSTRTHAPRVAPASPASPPACTATAPPLAPACSATTAAPGSTVVPDRPARACPRPFCPHVMPCPEHSRAAKRAYDKARPSSGARGYGRRFQQGLRRLTLARDPICTSTGPGGPCTRPSTDAAHIVTRRSYLDDRLDNLRGLCHYHHSQETAHRESGWGRMAQ